MWLAHRIISAVGNPKRFLATLLLALLISLALGQHRASAWDTNPLGDCTSAFPSYNFSDVTDENIRAKLPSDFVEKIDNGGAFLAFARTSGAVGTPFVDFSVSNQPYSGSTFWRPAHHTSNYFQMLNTQTTGGIDRIRVNYHSTNGLTTIAQSSSNTSNTSESIVAVYTNGPGGACVLRMNGGWDYKTGTSAYSNHPSPAPITDNFVPFPLDVCFNLSGLQTEPPEGMTAVDGVCQTSAVPANGVQPKHVQVMATAVALVLAGAFALQFRWKGTR